MESYFALSACPPPSDQVISRQSHCLFILLSCLYMFLALKEAQAALGVEASGAPLLSAVGSQENDFSRGLISSCVKVGMDHGCGSQADWIFCDSMILRSKDL